MREKNGGRWIGGGRLVRMRDELVRTRDGSMEVGQRRMRTRDGSVKMRDGSAEKLACTTEGSCVDGWFWASLVVPSPCSAWAWHE